MSQKSLDADGPYSSYMPVPGHGPIPRQRTAVAMIMSLVMHGVFLVAIGIVIAMTPRGTGETIDRPMGIAVAHRMPDRTRYQEPTVQQSPVNGDRADGGATSTAPPADSVPPLDLAGVLESMQTHPAPKSGTGLAGETDLGPDDFGDQHRSPRAAANDDAQTTVTLFGVPGSGSRFVYVFDRSDSMNGFGGRPLRKAKTELIRSLQTLTDRQQFQIVFYNDQPKPFQPGGISARMIRAEPGYLSLAENYVRSIAAYGGTSHEDALKLGLRMSPDVIFFLTDARVPRLSANTLREIKRRAESTGATIHAIEFGAEDSEPSTSFLRELATMNRGQYRYIDVRRLQRSGRP